MGTLYNLFSVTFYLSQMLYLKLDTFHLTGWLEVEDPQSAGVGGVCRGQLGRALQPQHRPHEGQQHGEQVTADCNLLQQLHNLYRITLHYYSGSRHFNHLKRDTLIQITSDVEDPDPEKDRSDISGGFCLKKAIQSK